MSEVTLGGRTYDLVPQRIGRISRKLTAVVEMFGAQAEGLTPAEIGSSLHEALKVFIPDLDPLWKLQGYGSAEAAEADEYEEAADSSPTPPEILDAIDTIFRIHGGERLVRLLKNVVGPEMIRAMIRNEYVQRRPSTRSASSPPHNGASGPTSSTAPSPTLPEPENEGSPLSGSLAS